MVGLISLCGLAGIALSDAASQEEHGKVAITRVTPSSGASGASVIIQGSGFSKDPSLDIVKFGNARSTYINVISSGQLRTKVPQGITPGLNNLSVTVNGIASNKVPFTILKPASGQVFIDETSSSLSHEADIRDISIIRAGDLDSDGDMDLIAVDRINGQMFIFINDGSGFFNSAPQSCLPVLDGIDSYTDMVLADFDGSGSADMAISSSASQSVVLLLNSGTGSFSDATGSKMAAVSMDASALDAGDVDNDGDIDIVVASRDSKDVLLLNDGSGSFTPDSRFDLPAIIDGSSDILFCDIDSDGDLDIVTSNNAKIGDSELTNRIYLNNGSGSYSDLTDMMSPPTAEYNEAFDAGDIDNDEDMDIFFAGIDQNTLIVNNGAGFYDDRSDELIPASYFPSNNTRMGDIDGDRDVDIIVTGESGTSLLINNGAGVFEESSLKLPDHKTIPSTMGGRSLEIADIDSDGDLDVILGNTSINVLKNSDENLPPIVNYVGAKTVTAGEELVFNVSALDPNGDAVSVSAQNLPPGASFEEQLFSWTPQTSDTDTLNNVQFIAKEETPQALESVANVAITVTGALTGMTDSSASGNSLTGTFVRYAPGAILSNSLLGEMAGEYLAAGSGSGPVTNIYKPYDNDVVIDFGPEYGVWTKQYFGPWDFVTSARPDYMLAADINYDGKDELIIDFGQTYGIWIKYDDDTWELISSEDAKITVAGDVNSDGKDELIIDFGASYGVWIWYDGPRWEFYSSARPDSIVAGDINGDGKDEVVADFGVEYGIWLRADDGSWTWISSSDPAYMTTADIDGDNKKEVIIDFGGDDGIWAWHSENTWDFIGAYHSEGLSAGDFNGDGTDEVILDMGTSGGLQVRYPDGTLYQISPADPLLISTGDMDIDGKCELIADFGPAYGMWASHDDGTWTKISSAKPYLVAIGNLHGYIPELDKIASRAFKYFWNEADPATGLVRDKLLAGVSDPSIDPVYGMASMASTGFGLIAMCVAAEHYGDGSNPDWQIAPIDLAARVGMILDTLIYIQDNQVPGNEGTWGKDGLFYHFVDMSAMGRSPGAEISSIDTAIVVAGAITAGQYFKTIGYPELEAKAQQIYSNVKWNTFLDMTPGGHYKQLRKEWKPETGYSGHWDYHDESQLLYMLAIGSPNASNAIGPECYYSTTQVLGHYGVSGKPLVQTWFGSLFAYQFPHVFLDMKNVHDARNISWWRNTMDATIADKQFCLDQDPAYGYNEYAWGLSSSFEPNSSNYIGDYGAPPMGDYSPHHDGTINTSVLASAVNIMPQEVGNAILSMQEDNDLWMDSEYGFVCSYRNASTREYADYYVGIDLGASMAIISNHIYSGVAWRGFMNSTSRYGTMYDLMSQLSFRSNTDPKIYIDVDDITEKSQFARVLVDANDTNAQIGFNLSSVTPSSSYLLALHTVMNQFVGSYDATVNISVNGTTIGDYIFSHIDGAEDMVRYINIPSGLLWTGSNTITITHVGGASWIAWKNVEISSPVVTNDWEAGKSDYANEYRLDDTYYAGHGVLYGTTNAYKVFEPALNLFTDTYTDIAFYSDDTVHDRTLTLRPFNAEGTVYVDAELNGIVIGSNIDMTSAQEILVPASTIQLGWNILRLQINDLGGSWLIWNSINMMINLSPGHFAYASDGHTTVHFRWDPVIGSDMRYNIYQSVVPGGPYVKMNTSDITTTGYTQTGLQDKTTYYYVVTSFEASNPAQEYISDEIVVTTGDYDVDFRDGKEPNAFGGTSSGEFTYSVGIRRNGATGPIRRLDLGSGASGYISLNGKDVSAAARLSIWIKGTGSEKIDVGLRDALSNEFFVTNITTADGWQNLSLNLSEFTGVSLSSLDRLIVRSASASNITLYLDGESFVRDAVSSSALDIVARNISDNSRATGVGFNYQPAYEYAPATQYLEITFNMPSDQTWKIWAYTKNDSAVGHMLYQFNGLLKTGAAEGEAGWARVPIAWRVYPDVQNSGSGIPCFEYSDMYNDIDNDDLPDEGEDMTWRYLKDRNDQDLPETPGNDESWAGSGEYPVICAGTSFSVPGYPQFGPYAYLADCPPGSGTRNVWSTKKFYMYIGGMYAGAGAGTYSTTIYLDLTHE